MVYGDRDFCFIHHICPPSIVRVPLSWQSSFLLYAHQWSKNNVFLVTILDEKGNRSKHNLSKLLSHLCLISQCKSDGQAQLYIREENWMLIIKSTTVVFIEKVKFEQILEEMKNLTKSIYGEGNPRQKEKLEKRL